MSFIKTGTVVELMFVIAVLVISWIILWQAMQGKSHELRVMPQFEAISDGVDRAVEQGLPVYVAPGAYSYLSGLYAPMTIAYLNILRHTARLAVRRGAELRLPISMNPETLPITDGIYREVCVAEGKPEAYHRENVFWSSIDENGYAIGLAAQVQRTGCATYVVVGALTGTGDINPTGTARSAGAVVIGGTARMRHQGTYAMLIDYLMVGPDLYAVAAQASGDPLVVSTIVSNDISQLILLLITGVGIILALAKLPVVSWLKT
ncbi:hypothetical protein MUP00_04985 [Candidatus Bathyarchaeota archaeon]|nr:hypothetical protein [Candidatus Bathyarchaeota archaeon]